MTTPPLRPARAGFSLIEILVATAVLAMLVALAAQLLSSGHFVISGSRRHLSADAQAREVFGSLGYDLRRMPRRADMDVVLSSSNNAIFFFSEAPAFFNSTNVAERGSLSLVGYRVNANARLERLGKGLTWTNLPFLTYAATNVTSNSTALAASTISGDWSAVIGAAPAYNNGADPDYHVLGDGVFRIFYCFQKKDGAYTLAPATNALQSRFAGNASLILTLAVVDTDSRKLIDDPTKLAAALPDPTQADLDAGRLPAQLWQAALDDVPAFASAAGIPPALASRVRIYQRSFPFATP